MIAMTTGADPLVCSVTVIFFNAIINWLHLCSDNLCVRVHTHVCMLRFIFPAANIT